MADLDPMAILRYYLIVEDLDESGESTVFSSMMYLKHQMFRKIPPFDEWLDEDLIRIAIDAMTGLAEDGLAEFWEPFRGGPPSGGSVRTADEVREWISNHLVATGVARERLERLTPVWWAGSGRIDDFHWGDTDAGYALFGRWFDDPPAAVTDLGERFQLAATYINVDDDTRRED